MHVHSYINSAITILTLYDGKAPFAGWLKNYFKQNKKFGSKDRKYISNLCFNFFRTGKLFADKGKVDKILLGLFLRSTTGNPFLEALKPGWNARVQLSLPEKFDFLQEKVTSLFPFSDELSYEINRELFAQSMLVQPDLFLRIRPGKNEMVIQKLQKAGLNFSKINEHCLALPNNAKVEDVLKIDEEVVVQDYNSQQTITKFKSEIQNLKSKISIWDCCAASGGKSILAHDLFSPLELTVSDVRPSILINLKNRFKRAGIKNFKSFVADLSVSNYQPPTINYQLIICDAPCSGSGTWSRTPEQLYYFKKEKIAEYQTLQKTIAFNAYKALKENDFFLYITCSVFEKENEEVVNFLLQQTSLQLISQQYLKGYDKKADTLFAALLRL